MILIFGQINAPDHLQLVTKDLFTEFSELTKKDYLFLFVGYKVMMNEGVIQWLEEQPYSTLLMDADGEVFNCYKGAERKRKFGGTVQKLSDSVYRFVNSGVFSINRKKYLIINFGTSKVNMDEKYHKYCLRQYKQVLRSLERKGNKVDRVISSIMPTKKVVDFSPIAQGSIYTMYLDDILKKCEFDDWYFTEHDQDLNADKFHCVYRTFVELDGKILTVYSDENDESDDYLLYH